ncbi:MAG: DUF5724 domain-containing protein, partial [Planctomycetota bacterium]
MLEGLSIDRARETRDFLLADIDEDWGIGEHRDSQRYGGYGYDFDRDLSGHLEATRRRLETRWTGDELRSRVTEAWLLPSASTWPEYPAADFMLTDRLRIVEIALRTCFEQLATTETIDLLAARVKLILSDPFGAAEVPNETQPERLFREPDATSGMDVLSRMDDPRALEHVEDFIRGRWNAAIEVPGRDSTSEFSGGTYERVVPNWPTPQLEALFVAGRLTPELFEAVARAWPTKVYVLPWTSDPDDPVLPNGDGPWIDAQRDFVRDLAWKLVQDPTREDLFIVAHFEGTRGVRFLVRACELLAEQKELAKLDRIHRDKEYRYTGISLWKEALGRMARIEGLDPGDDEETVIARLAEFDERVLDLVDQCAGAANRLVLEAKKARGGIDATPVIELVADVKETFRGEWGTYYPNDPDASKGVIDQARARPILEEFGEESAAPVLRRLATNDKDSKAAVTLLLALMGWNEDEVWTGVERRLQICVRAAGLLPLKIAEGEDAASACIERYRKLREFQAGSKKFGQQRRANEAGAVGAALANLAQTAGYPDPVRLEWAVEAASEAAESLIVEEDPYRLWIDADPASGPELVVEKAGKRLKSVPAALKKDERVVELKASLKDLNAQGRRVRDTLE